MLEAKLEVYHEFAREALSIANKALIEVEALKNSTHTTQFVPYGKGMEMDEFADGPDDQPTVEFTPDEDFELDIGLEPESKDEAYEALVKSMFHRVKTDEPEKLN